jgi:hypothetical protein
MAADEPAARKRARVDVTSPRKDSRDQQQEAQWRRRELGIEMDTLDGAAPPPLLESFEQLNLPAHVL